MHDTFSADAVYVLRSQRPEGQPITHGRRRCKRCSGGPKLTW